MKHSLDFITNNLTEKNVKILLIGEEQHPLAPLLAEQGYTVTENPSILEVNGEAAFDAVLFSCSLSKTHPLDASLNKAKALLNSKGKLLIEDFSVEQMDRKTAAWFYGLGEVMNALNGVAQTREENPKYENELERWTKEHQHQPALHTGKEISKAVERSFGNFSSYVGPYLYRYFIKQSEGLLHGPVAALKIFEWESTLIEEKLVQPLGLRIVAKPYFSYLK